MMKSSSSSISSMVRDCCALSSRSGAGISSDFCRLNAAVTMKKISSKKVTSTIGVMSKSSYSRSSSPKVTSVDALLLDFRRDEVDRPARLARGVGPGQGVRRGHGGVAVGTGKCDHFLC